MAPWGLTDGGPAEFLCPSLNPIVSFDVNIQHMFTNKLLPAAPLIAKLESLGSLGPDAKNALLSLPHAIREIGRQEVVLQEGDQPAYDVRKRGIIHPNRKLIGVRSAPWFA